MCCCCLHLCAVNHKREQTHGRKIKEEEILIIQISRIKYSSDYFFIILNNNIRRYIHRYSFRGRKIKQFFLKFEFSYMF
jgi:hypothetical protein